MATNSNSALYLEALKAIKLQGEQAPAGSDARKLYSTKADSLRNILKTQFGMMNIDADYGAGVALKDTPGGGNVDWNVLSNAADILGTSQAGSTRSAFDRALGEYLTRNLPVWQKAGATQPASASSSITNTTASNMGGTSAAQSIISGQPVRTASNTSGIVSTGTTPTAPAPINNMPTGANPNQTPTDVVPTGTGEGMGSGTNVYGDFIKSQYFANNDYEGYFISKTPNIPTVKDPTTGKVTIDWSNPSMPANMYTLYGNGVGFWNTAQGLSKEKANLMDISAIEKNPAFIEQSKVFTAEMDMLLKQNGLAIDAQLKGLEGSIAANKAGLEFELNTIKREVAASNWRSRQSLAASGMAFSGMLGYLYGQNEGKAMDATIRATAISAAEIKAMGEQMAILEGSKLSYASDLEGLYGAKRAAYRASLIDPSNKRYQEVENLLNEAIAGVEGTTQMATPSLVMGQRQAAGEAAQANYTMVKDIAKMAKDGIWLTPTADGKGYTFAIGLSEEEQLKRDTFMFDQWYKTEGLTLDWAQLDQEKAKQAFAEWAAKQGLALDSAKLNLEWAKLAETVRSNKVDEAAASAKASAEAQEAGGYDPKSDFSTLSNSGAPTEAKDLASLRLIVGTGALTADNFARIVDGQEYWAYVDDSGKTQFVYSEAEIPLNKRNFGQWITWRPRASVKNTAGKFAGIMDMNDTTFEGILKLVTDPVMAVALATVKDIADSGSRNPGDWVTIANAYIQEYGLGGAEQSEIHDLLRSYFNQ